VSSTGSRKSRPYVVLVVLLVTLGLLAGAFVVGDELLRRQAEREVVTTLSSVLTSDDPVTAKVSGWPYSKVLLTDTVDKVEVQGGTLTLRHGDGEVTLQDFSATILGLTHPRDIDQAVARDLTVTASMAWPELGSVLGVPLQPAPDQRVQVTRELDIFGAGVSIVMSAAPGVDVERQQFTLSDPEATLEGVALPSAVLQPLAKRVAEQIRLPDIAGLRYTSMTPADSGMQVEIVGKDVALSSLR